MIQCNRQHPMYHFIPVPLIQNKLHIHQYHASLVQKVYSLILLFKLVITIDSQHICVNRRHHLSKSSLWQLRLLKSKHFDLKPIVACTSNLNLFNILYYDVYKQIIKQQSRSGIRRLIMHVQLFLVLFNDLVVPHEFPSLEIDC